MAGKRVSFNGAAAGVSVASTATECLLRIDNGTGERTAIVEWEVSMDGLTTTDHKATIELRRVALADIGAGGTTVTGTKMDSDDNHTIVSSAKEDPAVAASSTTIFRAKLHSQGNYQWRGFIPVNASESIEIICVGGAATFATQTPQARAIVDE